MIAITIERYERLSLGIPSDVLDDVLKRDRLAFVVAQDMVVGLILKPDVDFFIPRTAKSGTFG